MFNPLNISWTRVIDGQGFEVAFTGMVIVFIALTVISLCITILPKVITILQWILPENIQAESEQEPADDEVMAAVIGFVLDDQNKH